MTLVQNLVQILRSPRVGPRQLSKALPELASASDQVILPLQQLIAAASEVLSAEPAAVEALSEMSHRAIEAQRNVSVLLAKRVGQGIGARQRLEIDALASSAVEQLADLCRLGELVSFVAAPRPGSVDLADVAGVGRELPQRERMAQADSRLLSLLLDVATRTVAGAQLDRAQDMGAIRMQRAPDGRLQLVVCSNGSASEVSESSRAVHQVLTGVARRSGYEWTVTETGGTLEL